MKRETYLRSLVIGSFLPAICTLAQCPDWRANGSGLHYPGTAEAAIAWDPDGPGGSPPLLVVGGGFTRVGGTPSVAASRIAAWNGTAWQTLGSGLSPGDAAASVSALAVYGGELVAAGRFPTAGGITARSIAAWNGTSWRPLDSGPQGWDFAGVSSLTVFNGELIAGGTFETTTGAPGNYIARWNGTAWHPIGSGMNDWVLALTVYNGELIAGGLFTTAGGVSALSVARWNGTAWRALGSGMPGAQDYVAALGVSGTSLFAGGIFTTAGGQPASNIAKWNGTAWAPLGAGIGGIGAQVRALASYNGDVIAGGIFTIAGTTSVSNIARYNGSSWQALGSGISGAPSVSGASVDCLTTYNSELAAGGSFLNAGGNVAQSVARWNSSTWLSMPGLLVPTYDDVSTFIPWAGSLVLGGYYFTIETNLPHISNHLASWDGTELHELGNPDDIVNAGVVVPGVSGTTDLVVGGAFTTIGGIAANRMARLNDALGAAWQPMGSGFNGEVRTITAHNGSIYAGGAFTLSGTTTVNRVARWTGSAWQPLGTGMNGDINALKSYLGVLYAGGTFTAAGGVSTGGLAFWNGTRWNPVITVFNGSVQALELYDSALIVGGTFAGTNNSPNIAWHNGAMFGPLGTGTNGTVRAFTVSNGTLVAGGEFTTAGGLNAAHLARWTGSVFGGGSWQTLAGGADWNVWSLGSFHNELQVGGPFVNVGTVPIESPMWARFSEDGLPWIARQPASLTVNCGADANLMIAPAAGYSGLTYQWRKNGVTVAGGATGTGSTIVVSGASLVIQHATPADAGAYDCLVSNGCGSTTSNSAALTVNVCQPCDVNCDGSVNSADAAALVQLLLNPGAARCSSTAGDMNQDGNVDAFDIQPLVACLIP